MPIFVWLKNLLQPTLFDIRTAFRLLPRISCRNYVRPILDLLSRLLDLDYLDVGFKVHYVCNRFGFKTSV